jgi:hypothetical protein
MERNNELEKTENFEENMRELKTIIGKPVEFSDDGIHKVILSEDSDVMSDEDFEEMLENNIPLYEDLTEEELLTRQKEFATLSEEGKEMLRDISGIQNSRIITLNALMCNSVMIIKDAEDDIEDIEFSEEYLKFLNWYDSLIRTGTFYPRYEENEKIFEDILNSGLENEDDNNIFAYFRKKYIEKVRGICKEIEEPLSGIEMEAAKRFESLSTTNVDLIKTFENIKEYEGNNWDTFSKNVLQ